MFRTASSVLHILPIAGLYTFLPKYLESQFRLAAHTANMISGVGGILVMGLGIIISGVFILRVKPNARFVAAWIAFTAVVYAIVQNTNLKLRGVSPQASYTDRAAATIISDESKWQRWKPKRDATPGSRDILGTVQASSDVTIG
ncbi:unnamed protein product [Timema podura]|uniref:Uncharacterized protein n=1 Tax=Timema podura TaxID=61482 RepID=A0ABN7NNK2_TIMPD|nr:unnamed protein product [Timema podura]